jgi:DNA-binding transcriptional ArsR family regulator
MPAAVHLVRDSAQAAALIDPARLALLEHLYEPDSASGLARKMNLPRQQVNYHLRELEKRELVEFVEERRKGNCLERVMRATARQYVVSPEALGAMGAAPPAGESDRFSAACLVTAAVRLIRDIGILAVRATRARKRLATLSLETDIRFRSAAERAEFAVEFAEAVARLAARFHDASAPGGRTFHCLAGVYPAITKQEDDGAAAARLE